MSWVEVYLVTNKPLTEIVELILSHTSVPGLLNHTLTELQFKTKQLSFFKHIKLLYAYYLIHTVFIYFN